MLKSQQGSSVFMQCLSLVCEKGRLQFSTASCFRRTTNLSWLFMLLNFVGKKGSQRKRQ